MVLMTFLQVPFEQVTSSVAIPSHLYLRWSTGKGELHCPLCVRATWKKGALCCDSFANTSIWLSSCSPSLRPKGHKWVEMCVHAPQHAPLATTTLCLQDDVESVRGEGHFLRTRVCERMVCFLACSRYGFLGWRSEKEEAREQSSWENRRTRPWGSGDRATAGGVAPAVHCINET